MSAARVSSVLPRLSRGLLRQHDALAAAISVEFRGTHAAAARDALAACGVRPGSTAFEERMVAYERTLHDGAATNREALLQLFGPPAADGLWDRASRWLGTAEAEVSDYE